MEPNCSNVTLLCKVFSHSSSFHQGACHYYIDRFSRLQATPIFITCTLYIQVCEWVPVMLPSSYSSCIGNFSISSLSFSRSSFLYLDASRGKVNSSISITFLLLILSFHRCYLIQIYELRQSLFFIPFFSHSYQQSLSCFHTSSLYPDVLPM